MNTGDLDHCKQFYEFLLKHNIYEQVMYNHTHYLYFNDSGKCLGGFLNSLFDWSKSPEKSEFWIDISDKLPRHLRETINLTVLQVFEYLLQTHTPQPYEYW